MIVVIVLISLSMASLFCLWRKSMPHDYIALLPRLPHLLCWLFLPQSASAAYAWDYAHIQFLRHLACCASIFATITPPLYLLNLFDIGLLSQHEIWYYISAWVNADDSSSRLSSSMPSLDVKASTILLQRYIYLRGVFVFFIFTSWKLPWHNNTATMILYDDARWQVWYFFSDILRCRVLTITSLPVLIYHIFISKRQVKNAKSTLF